MIVLPSREELRSLMEARPAPGVSIYLPTHRAGAEIRQDPIRLKNRLREAEQQLQAQGLRSTEAEEILEPIQALLPDRSFWQHQEEGLALFRSPELFRHYRVPLRFEELTVVAPRFHLKPLLPLLSRGETFFLLTLSQNQVGLHRGDRFGLREVDLPEGVPASLAEALRYDDPEKQLQFHTRTSGGGGDRAAIFHGHGVGTDDAKENLGRYFHQIDRGLQAVLHDERAPMVLAGVEYLLPIYREANSYPHLLPEGITGNPEELRPETLHEQAWSLLHPLFQQEQEEAADRYRQLAGTERASGDLKEIVPAASLGRVELLFVAAGVQQWGAFDRDAQALELHPEPQPGDEDLLDLAAIETVLNGGTVYAVERQEVPDKGPLAAVFRY